VLVHSVSVTLLAAEKALTGFCDVPTLHSLNLSPEALLSV